MTRFAVIGSGSIADDLLAAAALCPGFELTVCYSRTEAQARANAEKRGGRPVWDWDALLAAGDVDAVYVASPNCAHFAQAAALLRAGKHVLLEKPACVRAADFVSLRAAARAGGAVLMEAMRPAHLPCAETIRAYMDRLGPIRFASFPYCQYSSRYDRFRAGIMTNAFDPAMQGGALMDIGVYCAAWLALLFGAPRQVAAAAVRLPGSIDAVTAALLTYDGFVAELSSSKVHDSARPAVIEGERGYLEWSPCQIPRTFTYAPRGGKAETVRLDEGWPDIAKPDMVFEIRDFLTACEDPAKAEPYAAYTETALRITDRIREAAGIGF